MWKCTGKLAENESVGLSTKTHLRKIPKQGVRELSGDDVSRAGGDRVPGMRKIQSEGLSGWINSKEGQHVFLTEEERFRKTPFLARQASSHKH